MALKEAKGQGKKVVAANSAESLLRLLQGSDLTGLSHQLKAYVAPLNTLSGSGKENRSKTELHKQAKQYVPFLVQLLKLCTFNVATPPSGNDNVMQRRGDEVFAAMAVALDSLDSLRSFLTGSQFEIELQRCALVRRLMAWQRHADALVQCKKNYNSLFSHVLALEKESHKQEPAGARQKRVNSVATLKKKNLQNYVLPPPEQVDVTTGLPTLVAGIVIDLIWCTGENGPSSPEIFHALLLLPQRLEPWLGILDAGVAEKQGDTLFRGLYKCASVVVANPALYGAELVQRFSMLTIQHCASSTLREQYAKVAYKLTHCLSCHGADSVLIALDVSEAAMKNILQKSQLRGLWNNIDVLELVDCYARLCHMAKRTVEGWSHLCRFARQIAKGSCTMAPAAGLYAVGLRISDDEVLGNSVTTTTGDTSPPCVLGGMTEKVWPDLLQDGARAVENFIQQEGEKVGRKYLFGTLKALDFLRKHSAKYVQAAWASFVSLSCEESSKFSQLITFSSALRKILQLWFPLAKCASQFKDLTREEEQVLIKGWSSAAALMVAAFRLALICQQGMQESVTDISNILARNSLQPEELQWIMASSYNMGVQVFNIKNYDVSCYPFRVAHDLAWARVSSQNVKETLLQPSGTGGMNTSTTMANDLLLDNCVKSVTFAEALKRSGKNAAGFELLSDGLRRWATAHSTMEAHPLKFPSSLVHLWVEMLHTEGDLASKLVTDECPCMFTYFRCNATELRPRILGLLMEEELLVLEKLEPQDLDSFQSIREQQLQLLLDKVYTAKYFPVERCKILLEKGRLARMRGLQGIACVAEVVSILHSFLQMEEKSPDLSLIAHVENQLAMAYCVQALWGYELNPAGQEFLESIFSALKVWEGSLEANRIGMDIQTEARIEGQIMTDGLPFNLLFSIHDLLGLKGYSVVQERIQKLIISIASEVNTDASHKLNASLWANSRLNHVLCPVPHPSSFFSIVSQKMGITGDNLEFWQKCAAHCPGTMLDAQLQLILEALGPKNCKTSISNSQCRSGAFKVVEAMASSQIVIGKKTLSGSLGLAALFHMLAERASEEGKFRDALKFAMEGFNLRYRVLCRMFQMSEKGTVLSHTESSHTQSRADEGQRNKAGRLEVQGSVATIAWPTLTPSVGQSESRPSPWRVLGDYIESLMQLGVTYEKMGAVDDAERKFREGYNLSLAQHMSLAQASFGSCLGEVNRKRHRWEAAESHLLLAKQVFDDLEPAWVCNGCSLAGRALLCLRSGDLARRRGVGTQYHSDEAGSNCLSDQFSLEASDALASYIAAKDTLATLLDTVQERRGYTVCTCAMQGLPLEVPKKVDQKLLRKKGSSRNDSTESMQIAEQSAAVEMDSFLLSARTGRSMVRISNDQHMDVICEPLQTSEEADLVVTFTKMSLKQTEKPYCKEKEPAKRRGRPKKAQTSNLVLQRTEVEKRPTIRPQLVKIQEAAEVKVQRVAASDVGKVEKAQVRVKATGRKTVLKKPKGVDVVISHKETTNLEVNQEHCTAWQPDASDDVEVIVKRENRWSCKLSQRMLLSMDEWPAYMWTRYGHQLLARVSIQTGKLLLISGNCDEADKMYENAWHILGMKSDPRPFTLHCTEQPSIPEQTKSFYPVEEAGLLYHRSHLYLLRILIRGCVMEDTMSSQWLYRAFNLSTQMPPLLRKISRLLSILHVPIQCGGLSLFQKANTCSTSEQAAYFHQVSVGAGSSQQHLAVLDSRLMSLSSDKDKGAGSMTLRVCLEEMQQALTVFPINAGTVKSSVRGLVKGLPCSAVCCISLVDKEQASLLEQRHVDAFTINLASVWLLITRFSENVGPVTLLLPVAPLIDDGTLNGERSSSCPYDLHDHEDRQLSEELNSSDLDKMSRHTNLIESLLGRVAAGFGSILEESRQSTSISPDINSPEEKRQWWRWRLQLDARLMTLLRSVEDTWLGPWKCLLLGEPSSPTHGEALKFYARELCTWLRSSCGVQWKDGSKETGFDTLVQLLLQGMGTLGRDQIEEGITALLRWTEASHDIQDLSVTEKCQEASKLQRAEEVREQFLSEAVNAFNKAFKKVMKSLEGTGAGGDEIVQTGAFSKRTKKLTKQAMVKQTALTGKTLAQIGEGEVGKSLSAIVLQPLTLVLDTELHSLPWESLPVLRGSETYRMPSVGSILALAIHGQRASVTPCDREQCPQGTNTKLNFQEKCSLISSSLPLVDPCNTFYVLNPGGDLAKTQEAFEDWFKEQPGWKGRAGQVPTLEECIEGLQKHDLYTYIGHGSGDQYLPERYIRNLDRCAAALLMGCSSGRLSMRGDYEPAGVPLSYLMGGCPAAIANLWDVTDGDIDRFSRFVLQTWLGTWNGSYSTVTSNRNSSLSSCGNLHATSGQEVMEAAGVCGVKANQSCVMEVEHDGKESESLARGLRLTMGAAIGEGRTLCRLPYLIGAAPVYYGVPTRIERNGLSQAWS